MKSPITGSLSEQLLIAATKGEIRNVVEFAKQGGDVNYLSPEQGSNALFNACRHNDLPMINLLLELGCDVNQKMQIRYYAPPRKVGDDTALHHVQSAEAAELLLQTKAEINAQDKNGNTPLMAATVNHYPPVVRKLLNSGADFSCKNKKCQTALDLAHARLSFWQTTSIKDDRRSDVIRDYLVIIKMLEEAKA